MCITGLDIYNGIRLIHQTIDEFENDLNYLSSYNQEKSKTECLLEEHIIELYDQVTELKNQKYIKVC